MAKDKQVNTDAAKQQAQIDGAAGAQQPAPNAQAVADAKMDPEKEGSQGDQDGKATDGTGSTETATKAQEQAPAPALKDNEEAISRPKPLEETYPGDFKRLRWEVRGLRNVFEILTELREHSGVHGEEVITRAMVELEKHKTWISYGRHPEV